MIILGYIFTLMNYGFFCASRFCKKKINMLSLDLCAKITTTLGLVCFGSFSGVYSMITNSFVLLGGYFKEKYNKKWYWMFGIFASIFIAILILQFNGISSILVVSTSFVTLVSIWFLKPQQMRIVGAFCSLAYFAYQMTIKNYVGFLEFFVIASTIISYIKYRKEEASEQ